MKYKYLFINLLFLVLTFSIGFIQANELKILNPKVLRNDTLYLQYIAPINNSENDTLFAYIYSFIATETMPDGFNCNLIRQNNTDTLIGKFLVPARSICGLIKIGDGFNFDTQQGEFWDFIVINSDSLPMRNAHYRLALTYLGANPDNYRRTPDFTKALENYQAENMYYSDNLVSTIAEISLNYELGKIQRTEYEEQLQRIIASARFDWDNEEEIEVVIKSLRLLGKKKRANSLERKYASNYPNSKIAKQKEFEKIAQVTNFNDFIDNSQLFIKKYPYSEYNEKIYLAMIQSYLQTGHLDKMLLMFDNMQIPSAIYYQISYNLIENKSLKIDLDDNERYNLSKQLLAKALEGINTEEYPNLALTPLEVNKLKDLHSIEFLTLLAKIYWKKNQLDSLENVYNRLLTFDKRIFNKQQLYVLSIYANKLARFSDAFELSGMYLLNDMNDIKIKNINKNSYSILHPSVNYNTYIDSLNIIYKQRNKHLPKEKMINQHINLPAIKTLDGVTTSLKMFRGRILLVYSFGYFCEQCWDLFSDIDSLYKKYNNNSDVMVFPVLLWEKDKKSLKAAEKFIVQNKLSVSIYYDYLKEAFNYLSITGVPTITIIGQDGFVKFRIEGIKPEKSVYDEVKQYIDYLLNEE